MIEPTIIALMTEDQFKSQVPESVKDIAWDHQRVNGELVLLPQTWEKMTTDNFYIGLFGECIRRENAMWKGVNIGTRYAVKGNMKLNKDNVFGIIDAKLDIVLSTEEFKLYVLENN